MRAFVTFVLSVLFCFAADAGTLHLIAREPITHPPVRSYDNSAFEIPEFEFQTLTWDDPNPAEEGVSGYIVYERIGVDWFVIGKSGLERLFDLVPSALAGFASYRTVAVTAFKYDGETFLESARSEELDVRPGD